jgi:hypothetical protein
MELSQLRLLFQVLGPACSGAMFSSKYSVSMPILYDGAVSPVMKVM